MNASDQNPSARLTRLEIEVPGTPDQVWEAIATGAGIGGWMFPTDIEPREGGAMTIHRAPYGGDAPATVTAFQPPHRFAYEEAMGGPEDGSAPWATEFLVEARAGGSCVVRLVSGFYEHGEAWEDMVEGAGEGWRGALTILRAYLRHFAGRPATMLDATGNTGEPLADRSKVSRALLGALALDGLKAGDPCRAPADAPELSGVVEEGALFDGGGQPAEEHGVLLRSQEPAPGLFEISTFSMDGQTVTVNVSAHLYGPDRAAVVEREQPKWQAWLEQHFPGLSPTLPG